MPAVKVAIAIADTHLDQLLAIAQQLQSAGLQIDQTLPTLGIIHGSIEAAQIDRLYAIAGVEQVDPERSIQLPPPQADIQ